MRDLAGEARRQPEPCTDDTGQHDYEGSYAAVGGLGGGWHGRALRREDVLAWSLEHRSPLCRDHEGVEVVYEFFGTSGTLGERWEWRWWRWWRGGAGRAATSWSTSSVMDVSVIMQRQVPTVPLR